MSITICEFAKLTFGAVISRMQPVSETRRSRLNMLAKTHGSVAALNSAIGWPRTDPKLTQIRNANTRAGRANSYNMGDAMAREIEQALNLPTGWMDTPPTYAELHNTPEDQHDPRVLAHKVMEDMPADKVRMALKLLLHLRNQTNTAAQQRPANQAEWISPCTVYTPEY